ncbi:hypothetical protein BIWAKO_01077 [Bosea sp. BIWAKO-01]|nr:hypothetical protein BIWAKO_01077 [Bosea sp. BIWAKO-01]
MPLDNRHEHPDLTYAALFSTQIRLDVWQCRPVALAARRSTRPYPAPVPALPRGCVPP